MCVFCVSNLVFFYFHKDYVMELSLIIDSRMTRLFILYIRQLIINVILIYLLPDIDICRSRMLSTCEKVRCQIVRFNNHKSQLHRIVSLLYRSQTKLGGGGNIGVTLSVRLSVRPSVCLSPVCGHDFVHECYKNWLHGFF